MFLTTGAPSVVYRKTMYKSLTNPDSIQRNAYVEPTSADKHDPDDKLREHLYQDHSLILTDDERNALLNELGQH